MTRVRTEIELAGRVREETRSGSSSPSTLREVTFREDLHLFFAGFYYHPKLVDFNGDVLFGLEQRNVEYSSSDGRTVDGTNVMYDIDVDVLKEQPYTASVFATRREVWTRQAFFATNEALAETEGFAVQARDWWIPSTLTYRTRSFRSRGGNEYSEESDSWRLEGDRYDERGGLRYSAEVIDFQQRTGVAAERSERFNASYRRWLDDEGYTELRTSLSADRREGAIETSRYSLDNNLNHEFRPNLHGNAYLRLRRSGRDESTTDAVRLGAGISHRLFSSLTSSAGLGWGHTAYDAGSSDSWSASGSANYRKFVPFGWVRAAQSATVNLDRGDAIVGPVSVIGETLVYTPGVPLFLQSVNVEPSSVVVRDSAGLVVYVENVDYFLVQVGSRLRIDIPVSSLISPGDTLLVDYDFLPTPTREVRSVQTTTSAGFNVHEKVDFGVTYTASSRDVSGGAGAMSALEDSRALMALLQTFPIENVVLGAEYENYDSNQSPYQRYRAFGSWRRQLGAATDLATSADSYWLQQDNQDTESGSTARVTMTARLAAATTGSVSAEYHRVDLRIDDGYGYLFEAAYRQRWGPTSLRVAAQYAQEEFQIGVDQEIFRLEVVLTRTF